MDEHQKRFLKIHGELSYGRNGVINDWAEMSAISLSNAMMPDSNERREREARYLQLAKQYKSEGMKGICEMLACVVDSLDNSKHGVAGTLQEQEMPKLSLHDCLGEMYMSEEMRSRWDSDVAFTPFHVSYMIAKMTFGDNPIPEKGYLTIGEPACGTGCMVVAAAQALNDLGINFQRVIHVTATDIRLPLAQMAYIQLSLLHIPAVVIHGDSLSQEEWSRWRTPAHILGFWEGRAGCVMPRMPIESKEPQFSLNFEKGGAHESEPPKVVKKRRAKAA